MLYSNTQDLLTEIRKKKMLDEKINIKELANRMNKSPSAVSMALKQNISIESLNDICQAMNLNIDINFVKKDDTN